MHCRRNRTLHLLTAQAQCNVAWPSPGPEPGPDPGPEPGPDPRQAQRDIAERGATMEEVQKAIDGRKPDFKAYVEPQKEKADIVIQVRSQL